MNVRQLLPRTHEGYAACFAAAAVLIIVAALASMADAGGVRRAGCAPHVVHHQAAVVAAAIPYPVVGYQVGQYLQQQAVDEHAFRASPSKERLTYLEGYYQAKQEEVQQPEPPQVEESSTSEPQAFSAPQPPPESWVRQNARPIPPPPQRFLESTGEPLAPGQLESFAETHPLLAANCASCHASDESKAGFGIAAATHEAQAKSDAEAILGLITPIAARTMPKGKEITDTERIDAINELLSK